MDRDPDRLFHIVSRDVWSSAATEGWYRPDSLSAEGFVHLSYTEQVLGVADRFYRDLPDPVVVEFGRAALAATGADVRDEDTYGSGQRFPHLYGPLPTAAAVAAYPLVRTAAGFGWELG